MAAAGTSAAARSANGAWLSATALICARGWRLLKIARGAIPIFPSPINASRTGAVRGGCGWLTADCFPCGARAAWPKSAMVCSADRLQRPAGVRPEWHAGHDRAAGSDKADGRVDALPAVGRPVDVLEVKQ